MASLRRLSPLALQALALALAIDVASAQYPTPAPSSLPRRTGPRSLLPFSVQGAVALQYAAEALKADREVVLAAVQQNGWALQDAAWLVRVRRGATGEGAGRSRTCSLSSDSLLSSIA